MYINIYEQIYKSVLIYMNFINPQKVKKKLIAQKSLILIKVTDTTYKD